ncbi:hypothetical protein GCM10009664_21250 [Kitasatospora gansuensis]
MTLDRSSALQLGAEFLAEDVKTWTHPSEVRIIPEASFGDANLLIIPYDTTEFLDRGISSASLMGNLPISVNLETGECDFIDMLEVLEYINRGLM